MRIYLAIAALLLGLGTYHAYSQAFNSNVSDISVAGAVANVSTVNKSTVTSGGFLQIMPSITGNAAQRRQSLTIQNNQASGTDNCWIYIGPVANATKATSIVLAVGQAYGRYWPYVPSDQISAACATSGDTLYVDFQ